MSERKEIVREVETFGYLLDVSEQDKINIALDVIKPEQTKIESSLFDNELIILEKKTFNEIEGAIPNRQYTSKGCYLSWGGKYFIVDCVPVFGESDFNTLYYKGVTTKNLIELTYDVFISYFNLSYEQKQEIDAEIDKLYEKDDMYYEVSLNNKKQYFYFENNLLKGDYGAFSINIHKNEVELYIGGLEIKFDCALNDFKNHYENKLKNDMIEFSLKNKVVKLENGYVLNNVYYETINDICLESESE